jgi:hypothetical protein
MATVAETMRRCLLNYPGIFPCPMAVATHWFTCIGNGMEWRDGELCHLSYRSPGSDYRTQMKYDDLDELEAILANYSSIIPNYNSGSNIEIMSQREGRKFVEQHIDILANGKVTVALFGYRPSSYYFIEGICPQYARALNAPANITKDWAIAVYDFCEKWKVALREKYDLRSHPGELPENIQNVFKAIEQTYRTIFPALYGADYDTVMTNRNKLIDRIVEEDNFS